MEPKGFFGALMDFSFSEFVTTKIIKVLYILGIVGVGIFTIVGIAGGFMQSAMAGILYLVLSPVIFIIGVIVVRVYMEIIIVFFRIAENTSKMAEK